jgi:hypothetical protein
LDATGAAAAMTATALANARRVIMLISPVIAAAWLNNSSRKRDETSYAECFNRQAKIVDAVETIAPSRRTLP